MEKSIRQKSKEKRVKDEYCREKHGLGWHWNRTLDGCTPVPGYASALKDVYDKKPKDKPNEAKPAPENAAVPPASMPAPPQMPAQTAQPMQTVPKNSQADAAIKAELQKRAN
jgi:hypothetical protein